MLPSVGWMIAHAQHFVHCRTSIPNRQCIPFQAAAFKIHYVNFAIIVISIRQCWTFTRLWVCTFPQLLLLLDHSQSNAHTHSQNINKRLEIKRFRCFFSALVCAPWLLQKRRNFRTDQLHKLCTLTNQHFCLISDDNYLHKSFLKIFINQISGLYGEHSTSHNNFHDTNSENSRLSAGKFHRLFWHHFNSLSKRMLFCAIY